ncbi:Polysaccharide pyruvyl transferase [Anatilimnocola aggregata]|uniref:Polysaccharide pyruvyl transferase n=1 Tax=Anatilimnocola aggregata TaxID=2528021 RepID=A0A517YMH7_9BACT|nr:polysaccharide pyruvyl transferase family protein [Anatilimnocola aggregata]QDU31425.1 Polysaccharide pyruvyl transferase [Anatilimnocola aggregata]
MQRREFLQTSLGSALAAAVTASLPAQEKRKPKVLLRNAWQTVNIGDIGHTPGILTILEKHVPEIDVTLWPSSIGEGVEPLLLKRFPNLKIAKGKAEIDAAVKENDFLLHGSGSGFVAVKDVGRWQKETGKPYGIWGISHAPEISDVSKQLLSGAKFCYFRDGRSVSAMKKAGVTCPVMEFGPDGAFAVDLRNDALADKYLQESGLETGKFMCCIPRLRYTPYWLIKKDRPFDEKKHARNEEMKEHDNAPLRDAVIALVRETDMKVLVCPEDMSQMAVGKETIMDKLPADVAKRVVWRENYWLTDEALSVFVRSAGLFGNEMHSPIMCIGNGVPAIVCRFAEQTTKGWMWDDIGLKEWLFDHDFDEAHKGLTAAVLGIAKDPAGAKAKAAKAHAFVQERQRVMSESLKQALA